MCELMFFVGWQKLDSFYKLIYSMILIGGSLVKGGTKHKCQGYQIFKEQYLEKIYVKSNVLNSFVTEVPII